MPSPWRCLLTCQDQQGSMEELRLENDHPCAVPKTLVTEPTSQGTENRPTEGRL
ncbi:hypothetical protein ACRRTK_020968 [Alexandromys fortis]